MKLDEMVSIGDFIVTTGSTDEKVYEGVVSGIDNDMELVFVDIDDEVFAICAEQITDNFGKIKTKEFI